MKGSEGLSDLAKHLLELAGNELSKRTVRQLMAIGPGSTRSPATIEDVEKLYVQIYREWQQGKRFAGLKERQRLAWLKRLNDEADASRREKESK